jgi:hypothetical protein
LTENAENETALLAIGSLLTNQQLSMETKDINDYEFKIFSQFGDDGIIQYLIKNLEIKNQTFIEFGVGDYRESNTRFLMMNNNWSGFVMDSSSENMARLQNQNWYWKYDLRQKTAFITRENINGLLSEAGFSNIGLLHIDIDGVDYHIFNEMDLIKLNPAIIILEYNSVFGLKPITVPYSDDFDRTKKHFSNLYFGASITALEYLATRKGYSLVGSNLAGNNAYFIRNDLLTEKLKKVCVIKAYKKSKFRESRTLKGELSFLEWNERCKILRGLEVLNVITNEIERL